MKKIGTHGSIFVFFFLFLALIDLGVNPTRTSNIDTPPEPETKIITDTSDPRIDLNESENQKTSLSDSANEGISDSDFEKGNGFEDLGTQIVDSMSNVAPEADLIDLVAREQAMNLVKIAQSLCDKNLYREGLAWADDALRLDPGLPEAHLISGYLHFKLLNTDEAIMAFERTIQLEPDNYSAYLYLGIIYNGNDNPILGLEYLTRAIQLADCPKDISTAFAHRALSYALLDRYDESFADFEDALFLDPNNGWAIFFRGIVRAEVAKRERSASEVEGIPFDNLGLTK